MILECDIGNTRCGWRALDQDGLVTGRGGFVYAEQGFGKLAALHGVAAVRALSVASAVVVDDFTAAIYSAFGVMPRLAVATESCAGVTNAYMQPVQLGVDRWSALVAAYRRVSGAVLVIDAGSALTVDAVAANGRHLGGYIVPGINYMKAALLQKTGGVRFDHAVSQGGTGFGESTAAAVNAGVMAAELGVVVVAIKEAVRRMPDGFSLLLTGGDAEMLSESMEVDHCLVSELVLDGLRWLLPCSRTDNKGD